MNRNGREVRSGRFVALVWERHQGANGRENFGDHPIGGVKIVAADKFPNLVEVNTGFRVEVISGHEVGWDRRAAALFSRKYVSTSSPGMSFTLPLFRSS